MSNRSLVVGSSANRALERLPEGIAAAIVEFMVGPLLEAPTTVGKPLRGQLSGYWSARRGAYRVVYRLDNDNHNVVVVRVDHRCAVYRSIP